MTRAVKVGNITVGGGAPISVQSMLCVPAGDISGNVAQAQELERAGCEIIRAAVPAAGDAALISALKNAVSVPIVADIHFDYMAALAAIEAGADKIRINPGNIGDKHRLAAVVEACIKKDIPIRVGVNSGSLEKPLLEKYGGPTAQALAQSALDNVKKVEQLGCRNVIASMKSSDVVLMTKAYRLFAAQSDVPVHLGVTEAGGALNGIIKSSVGIGSLLIDDIGDTIRVSLTDNPVREVEAGIALLKACGLRHEGVDIISCPTCGRTQIDLIGIAARVEAAVKDIKKPLKVAVMGCVVNGPGEAANADIGIAGGNDCAVLFKKGKTVRKIEGDIAQILIDEIKKM